MCSKVKMKNRIIYILLDFSLMEPCSGCPAGTKRGNDKLICVDKMPWWLYDLCCSTLVAKWNNHLLYKPAVKSNPGWRSNENTRGTVGYVQSLAGYIAGYWVIGHRLILSFSNIWMQHSYSFQLLCSQGKASRERLQLCLCAETISYQSNTNTVTITVYLHLWAVQVINLSYF